MAQLRKTHGLNLQKIILFGLAISFSMVILLIDLQLPLTIAFSTMYIVVVLYSWLLPGQRTSTYTGIFCTVLMIIGFFESPSSEVGDRLVGINCILSLIVLWVGVTLVSAAKRGFGRVENMVETLEEKVAERTVQLHESQEELRESEQLYRYLYEHANEMYVSVDPIDATIIKCNETLCKKLGYTKEELLGKSIFFVYHESCMDDVKKAFTKFQKTGQVNGAELTLRNKNGKKIEVILNVSSATDSEGNILYSRSSWTDVTDYKKTQKALRERGDMLELQNKELEQFVYIASHDLQEPLRTVSSFTEFLKEKYADTFDEQGEKSMQFILEATDRMRTLIKGLLDYGLIGKNKVIETVDFNSVLNEVRQDMNVSIEEINAEMKIGKMPKKLKAYPTEIHQLFQNLISNAIKFRKKDVDPVIEISSSSYNGHWKFAVSDNGIGIADEHKDRIFKIFQRLHNRKEFKGTGIGLAHCKKILDLHQGDIWVESKDGEGSIFYFTIPKRT